MVHATVDDGVRLAARLLHVDHAGDVDAGLADEVATELERHLGLRQPRRDPLLEERAEPIPDPRDVEPLVLLEVGDPEAAAEVEVARLVVEVVGELEDEVDGARLGLHEDVGPQVLRAGEDVEAEHVDVGRRDLPEQRRDQLGVHAELLRSAAHPHARALDRERRVDPDGSPREEAELLAGADQPVELGARLDLDQGAGGHRAAQLGVGLAGTGEADPGRVVPGVEGDGELAGRGDVEGVDQSGEVLDERRHRVGLHRVAQGHAVGQGRPHLRDPGRHGRPVVGEERRGADPGGQPPQRDAGHDELLAVATERRQVVLGPHGFSSSSSSSSWLRSSTRSNFPLGPRGSSARTTTSAGTM